jgi:hypothetical protein
MLGVLATATAATHNLKEPAAIRASTDSTFLNGIHRAGIVAPDAQAIQIANQVARLNNSGASDETIFKVVRDFGVYDYHVDAFTAAAIAAYEL